MQHSKLQILNRLYFRFLFVSSMLSLKELYFMELLPLLPSDDPANKQPVEVSATMLSRKNRTNIKNKITHITLYLSDV